MPRAWVVLHGGRLDEVGHESRDAVSFGRWRSPSLTPWVLAGWYALSGMGPDTWLGCRGGATALQTVCARPTEGFVCLVWVRAPAEGSHTQATALPHRSSLQACLPFGVQKWVRSWRLVARREGHRQKRPAGTTPTLPLPLSPQVDVVASLMPAAEPLVTGVVALSFQDPSTHLEIPVAALTEPIVISFPGLKVPTPNQEQR